MALSEKINLFPNKPGCYLYKNIYGTVIYVGKAKNLKNRVKSYFASNQSLKTQMLLKEAVDVDYIITSNELESLILELNLIKEYDPKYNILLKDDKSYPYILITDELYPKVKITRNRKLTNGELFGPYPNGGAAKEMVEIINRNYPLVKCRSIPNEACLYYHIGQCLGPCIKKIDTKLYNKYVDEAKKILKGHVSSLRNSLKKEMEEASKNLNYERAIELRKNLESIETIILKQNINVNKDLNIDVINYSSLKNKICIQLLYIRRGTIIEGVGEIFDVINEHEDILTQYILNLYYNKTLPEEIIVPNLKSIELIRNIIPTKINYYLRGSKSKYLGMAKANANIILNKYFENESNEYNKTLFIKEQLKEIINIECYRIDMFDVSHHNGANVVGALVVCKNYIFDKKNYRKFKLTANSNDDVANTKEIVYRYYYKCLMNNLELPDLIIADGGINQVNVIKEVVKSLNLKIYVLGLIKDNKHVTKEIIYENKRFQLNKRSVLYKFLVSIQDEVHKFAIGYHHTLASKSISASVLDNITGIGSRRKQDLIRHFKSLENIKNATLSDLESVVPSNIAKNIIEYFKKC
ncbi:MAG: excinuclease ABC subunit UvrC [Bacilli bacterium]